MNRLINWFKKRLERFPGLSELDPDVRKIVVSIFFCLVMLLLLTANMLPIVSEFMEGEPSPAGVASPQNISVLDEERTELRRQLALEGVPDVYEENRDALQISRENYSQAFSHLEEFDIENNRDELENRLNEYGVALEGADFDLLFELDTADLEELYQLGERILENLYMGPVREGEMDEAEKEIRGFLEEEELEDDRAALLSRFLTASLVPNLRIDQQATAERQEDVLAGVEPVYVNFAQGENIVNEGEIISPVQYAALDEIGLSAMEVGWFQITGTVLFFIILTMVMVFYFKNYLSEIWQDNNKLFLLEVLIVIVFFIAWILSFFDFAYIYFLIPVGMLSVLITVLLSTAPAVAATIYVSLLLPLMFDLSFNLAVAAFVSGMVGSFSVAEVNQRSDLVRAGFNISGVLIFTVIMLSFIQPAHTLFDMVLFAGIGALNGILVAILANGLLPYLENIFNLTSAVKLLELSNPNQPLLKRLLVEAPGTYHHSMVVGNLAETAADNIGADALLTRVGAYYHDIGKLKRPYFFTDNQFGGENPHDDINPNLSSLIIKSHVKDGVKMAEEHDLPRAIIDLIEQHQGTNLISYFYQEAVHNDDHSVAAESDFRYEGPKPRSKEAAILMLADVVEAAVRSKNFDKTDPNRIENLIRGLIREKLLENQLDESELTLDDLNTIAESFTTIMTGIYHQRVEYPDDLEEELEEMEGKTDAEGENK